MSCFVLGIDPDLHNTAAAIVGTSGVYDVKVFSIEKKYKGERAVAEITIQLVNDLSQWLWKITHSITISAVVVEGQKIYSYTKADHTAIIHLAQVAGVALGAAYGGVRSPSTKLYLPAPSDWKGSVPKHIHQARVLKKMGIPFEVTNGKEPYCVPVSAPALHVGRKSNWKHAVDAIGLAVWGVEKETLVKF